MTHTLWVATRKGLFAVRRTGGGWTYGPPHFLGDPVTMVLDDARDGIVYAALNLGHFGVKLHRSRDRGRTWDECRVPVDARLVVSRTRDGGQSFDVLDRGLPAPSYDLVYRHALDVDGSGTMLAMGSTTGGLWVSADGGDSWETVSAHLPPIYCVRWSRSA